MMSRSISQLILLEILMQRANVLAESVPFGLTNSVAGECISVPHSIFAAVSLFVLYSKFDRNRVVHHVVSRRTCGKFLQQFRRVIRLHLELDCHVAESLSDRRVKF